MTSFALGRRALMAAAAAALTFGTPASAEQVLDKVHFLIPGGAGGGWDGTARGTGEALTKGGLVGTASYENMSGGGGGKAIGYMIENAESLDDTLMVNSTPIVIRSPKRATAPPPSAQPSLFRVLSSCETRIV